MHRKWRANIVVVGSGTWSWSPRHDYIGHDRSRSLNYTSRELQQEDAGQDVPNATRVHVSQNQQGRDISKVGADAMGVEVEQDDDGTWRRREDSRPVRNVDVGRWRSLFWWDKMTSDKRKRTWRWSSTLTMEGKLGKNRTLGQSWSNCSSRAEVDRLKRSVKIWTSVGGTLGRRSGRHENGDQDSFDKHYSCLAICSQNSSYLSVWILQREIDYWSLWRDLWTWTPLCSIIIKSTRKHTHQCRTVKWLLSQDSRKSSSSRR